MIGIFIIFFAGCRTIQVTVLDDYDGNFQLNDYITYDFFEPQVEGVFNAENNESINLIKEEISRQMADRGLSRDTDNPDLMVNIGIQVEERTQTRETGLVTDPGTFTYVGQRRYSWRSETVETGRYRYGTATLHLVDTEKDRAVWVGVVEEILPRREAKLKRTIRDGVKRAFEKIDEN